MINLAVIGCGYWGPNLVRIFSDSNQSRVKYVCDINAERLKFIKEKFPAVELISDYKTILQDPTVDAVVIATNLTAHEKAAGDCLRAGKHVLIEKPLTNSVKTSQALAKLAAKNKKILMVGHTFLYNPGVVALKKYLDQKEIGKLLYMHAERTNLGPIRKDTNALWDLASHDIAVYLYLINDLPLDVSARGGKYLKENVEDVVFLTMNFPGGIVGHVHVSWLEPCKVRRITLIGDKKMAVFNDINPIDPIRIYDKGVNIEKRYDTFGEFQLILRDGDILSPKIQSSEPLKNECVEFLKCVAGNTAPTSDGKFGVKVVKVLEAAQRSLDRGGKIVKIV
jgi:predicted dehydrogenase